MTLEMRSYKTSTEQRSDELLKYVVKREMME